MDTRTPYFYIIRLSSTGQQYAGCKWGKNCQPEQLLKPDGYHTSSPMVKRLIEEHGLDAFEVVETKTEAECCIDVRLYETKFLQDNKCASSSGWLNSHNNDSNMSWGTPEFKSAMIKTHGVSNPSQSEAIRLKKIATWERKYGVSHPSLADAVKSKKSAFNLNRYGVENPMQSPEVVENYKNLAWINMALKIRFSRHL